MSTEQDWRDYIRQQSEDDEDALRDEHRKTNGSANGAAIPPLPDLASRISVAGWLGRDIPEPDFLLGEVFSTTNRGLLAADTGLGKTNFAMAIAFAKTEGRGFLHWRGSGRAARILDIDGEMSERLVKSRIADAARRAGGQPANFYMLSRSEFPEMPPLNTPEGQQFIDQVIAHLGGIDFTYFDNVQALLNGDMKDEEPWQATLPWIRELTRRNIGQLWIHHTGHDTSHAYGTKTREWQLDTVALMEKAERPEADIAFSLKFPKARERSPDNRADFELSIITLANDEWTSERGGTIASKATARDRALELLRDAITRDGEIPPASEHIPPYVSCITEKLWFAYCEKGCISEGKPDAVRMAFNRAAKSHLATGRVGKWGDWVWLVK